MTRLFKINLDIFIRTLAVISSMALFMNSSAAAGKVVLVANAVLLNLQTFAAHGMDDFAHATESRIGRAIGACAGAVGGGGPQQLGDGAGAWPDLFRRRWLDRRRAHHS